MPLARLVTEVSRSALAATLFLAATSLPVRAQPNTIPNLDVQLWNLGSLSMKGHVGTFPIGQTGLTMSTTVCNTGMVDVLWEKAMDPDHPFIAFLIARESNGRLEQISDRSFVKHGFQSTNSGGCGTCQHPGTNQKLGPNCSDTYSTTTNGNRFWLGPAEEIDPWLGAWDPVCSHFDRGEPAVPPPADCDGVRSLTTAQTGAMDPVLHRVTVQDVDLDVPGARFWYQAQYVVAGEVEALRFDDLGSREFTVTNLGGTWDIQVPGTGTNPLVMGSVLQRWTGATIGSAANGGDDGRVYVAVRVTGPVGGTYHWEIAVHDRDNQRGIGALRLPFCDDARVQSAGFRDVDADPTNDWSFAPGAGELVFVTTQNPIRWNTFYNFWFDTDAAPAAGTGLVLDPFDPGPGAASLVVALDGPTGLWNVWLGAGCATGGPIDLYAFDAAPRATLGNLGFGVEAAGLAPGAPTFFLASFTEGTVTLGPGCDLYTAGDVMILPPVIADAGGVARQPFPIPNLPALEGLALVFQAVEVAPGAGALLDDFNLSNGLRVRIGNAIPDCP